MLPSAVIVLSPSSTSNQREKINIHTFYSRHLVYAELEQNQSQFKRKEAMAGTCKKKKVKTK